MQMRLARIRPDHVLSRLKEMLSLWKQPLWGTLLMLQPQFHGLSCLFLSKVISNNDVLPQSVISLIIETPDRDVKSQHRGGDSLTHLCWYIRPKTRGC